MRTSAKKACITTNYNLRTFLSGYMLGYKQDAPIGAKDSKSAKVLNYYRKCNILVIRTSALQTNALRILWNEALRKASCLSISESNGELLVSCLLA